MPPPDSHRTRLLRNGIAILCALLVYYGIPLNLNLEGRIIGVLVFLVGLAGLAQVTDRHIRRLTAAPQRAGRQVDGILLLLTVTVVFFALTYYLLAKNDPGQFDGLVTRTDALYYTIVTLGTVGFGDVHAVGQTARVVTMLQIVFDLVVVGILLAVATGAITRGMRGTSE
ncbi:potassium channel family protein [Nocardia asteroides]|uniref:potassium channel family protein n=1 Tax=Nocardia asteroides TaxID=1824 RepID=UPI001E45F6E6|nr:potassium channel family protein [Nocardia asteroides]UGT64476.1 potassium channel family protein [Nocardia asteroides]